MTHQVVVAVEGELSAHDASAAVAQCATGRRVDCHLLIATREAPPTRGLAMLGVRPGDTFGSEALARRMHVQVPGDDATAASDLGKLMAQSAEHLRSACGGEVTVSIAHGDMLAGARALMNATGSQDAIFVVDPGRYPQFAMPEWKDQLSVYLGATHVHAIEHVAD
ncbi:MULTISPECIES: hypothetical protein [Kribbella]|uniref:Universal stress protein n=1 Tax=Kribbella karoonensis TaxID=324851 RepID=A0ABN2D2M3_9ACTN